VLRSGIRTGVPASALSTRSASPGWSPFRFKAGAAIRTIVLAVPALAVSIVTASVLAPPGAEASDGAAPATAQAVAAPSAIGPNLLQNEAFAKGAGNSPDHWRTESWDQRGVVTTYRWNHPAAGGPGELEVDSAQPNDARWMQSLSLGAGWYYMSVEARTENVGSAATGASISVMEDGISSEDLKGTVGWTPLGLYLKVGKLGADLELSLRVGGYASLNTGRAFFRNASVVAVAAPPAGAQHVFDLDAIRKQSQTPPVGEPWTLVAAFILLGAVAVVGWQLYGEAVIGERPRAYRGRAVQAGRASQPTRSAPSAEKQQSTPQQRQAQSGRAEQPELSEDSAPSGQSVDRAAVEQSSETNFQGRPGEGRKPKRRKKRRSGGAAGKPTPPERGPAS
jgi:hypothetical protein